MVKFVKDRTGRFNERPHYEPSEIDYECEKIITEFLQASHGEIKYPISTDDLTLLIERDAESLDLYADLSGEGQDVEGMTTFIPGRKPVVKISKILSETGYLENRLRTTLTHEFGHMKFHGYLWDSKSQEMKLFQDIDESKQKCKRESITGAKSTDWMEWQAGYVCGAILMPISEVKRLVKAFMQNCGLEGLILLGSSNYFELIRVMSGHFQVSDDAARVRLLQLKLLTTDSQAIPLY